MFPKDMRILVVDDFKTMRKIVTNALTAMGFTNIQEAEDGEAGYTALEAALAEGKPYGMVVSDWNMPKLQGIDLLKKVRGHEKMKVMPFVLVTAEAEQSNIVDAVKAGVSNYVVKPFSPAAFAEKIQAVYKRHHPNG